MSITEVLSEACRMYVLVVLLVSTGGKLIALPAFSKSLSKSMNLSERHGWIVAAVILSAEGFVGVLLLRGGAWARTGMGSAVVLFLAFTAYLASSLRMKKPVYCQCFGISSHVVSVYDVLRNIPVIVAGAIGAVSLQPGTSLDFLSYIMLSGAALVIFIISMGLREILSVAK